MATSQATTERTAALFGSKATKGTVLVVDDEPDLRKLVRLTLEKAGYDVIEAANGEEAIMTVNSGENSLLIGVLLTGLRMPRICGEDTVRYFRLEHPSIEIVVLAGWFNVETARFLFDQGVVDYLPKPVTMERLLAAVNEAMERRRFDWLE